MMPTIRIAQTTYDRLERHITGFNDKPDNIISRALDALDEKLGRRTVPRAAGPAHQPEREANGKKTPQKEFRGPLLDTLVELGGSARTSDIRLAMEPKVAASLTEADRAPVSTGEPRWWNATCWERSTCVQEGLIESGTPRGIWAITPKGRAHQTGEGVS
jgi:hypothetical protein